MPKRLAVRVLTDEEAVAGPCSGTLTVTDDDLRRSRTAVFTGGGRGVR